LYGIIDIGGINMSNICKQCANYDMCKNSEYSCPALTEIIQIYNQTRNKDRHQLVKKIGRKIGIVDAEPSKGLSKLAEQIMDKFPGLHFIREYGIRIGYVMSQERPTGSKVKYADCTKVKIKYQAWLPYDFIITFYEPNIEILSENQRKILMLHELKHIGIGERGLKLEEHDIEDFRSILKEYGIDWNRMEEEVPDILSEDNVTITEG